LAVQADGWTLFLDEIDALSLKGQVVLLRFLEEKKVRPLGDESVLSVDVRVIAASNVPLARLVESGALRQDLYYRISVLNLDLPPLRERRGDIPLLADYFLRRCNARYDNNKSFDQQSYTKAETHRWPGNVRELENAVERAYLMGDSKAVSLEVPDRLMREGSFQSTKDCTQQNFNDAKTDAVNRFEKQYLRNLMIKTGGNVTRAAILVGKERRALGKLLNKHDLDRRQFANPQR
jgi:DNA-binding NtrC family response regulator